MNLYRSTAITGFLKIINLENEHGLETIAWSMLTALLGNQIRTMSTHILSIFEQYTQELRGYLTGRIRCAITAEDLMQETYIRLQRIEHPHLIMDVRTYMFRIAANLATDHLRAQRRRAELIDQGADFLAIEDPRSTPERILLAKEELKIVEAALQDLSPLCRKILTLNRLEGLKHSAIAERLGISRSAVEKNIAKAMLHFRRRITRA
ncbi:RNA polymerase sigma factor [Nitrospira sp. M1]